MASGLFARREADNADLRQPSSLPKRLSEQNASSQRLDARTGKFYIVVPNTFLLLNCHFYCRPIPQWFRLKTDTKIQVRPP